MLCRSTARRHAIALICAALVLISVTYAISIPLSARAQTLPPAQPSLRITGRVAHPLVLSERDLQSLAHNSLTVADDKGLRVTYGGGPVVDLLRRAGVPLGKQLKGLQMRLYVIVTGADGYQAVFALPEFDPGFTDRVIILAVRRDGHPLPAPEGPFRLIVDGEKRRARWVREVTTLDVEQAQ